MSITITEAWIRERVQLTHDNLEDVRSLSLPGTYQEKVGGLGNALSSFTRLKHLDLSRNALQSLHGLQHLHMLEKLNLYYNNISSLQELGRLRHNTSLQELDLRLNPVTKNEPDYRLYLVHLLPSLRKLDDRSVRESERKSALLHFDSDQASNMTEHSASPLRGESVRGEAARTRHLRGLGPRTAIEEDDCDLLDLLARTDGDLSKARPVTGSGVSKPTVDVHTQDYPRSYSQRTPPRTRPDFPGSSLRAEKEWTHTETEPPQQPVPDRGRARGHLRSNDEVAPEEKARGGTGSNLQFTDEDDAYTAFSSKVNFTPNPKSDRDRGDSSYDVRQPLASQGGSYEEPPPVQRVTRQVTAASGAGQVQRTFLDDLLNLVDRYWNGSKSLHSHSKFQSQAQALMDRLLTEATAVSQEQIDRLQLDVARYAQENVSLRSGKAGSSAGVQGQSQTRGGGGDHMQRALTKAQADVDALHGELEQVKEANRQLTTQLEKARKKDSMVTSESKVSSGRTEQLQQDNDQLRLQLKHFTQLQELASMLQESHKSLVTTNEHLLQELEETKHRHLEEVKQLHWSYSQLKQTMDLLPPSTATGPLHTPRKDPAPQHAPWKDPASQHTPWKDSSTHHAPQNDSGLPAPRALAEANGYGRGGGAEPTSPPPSMGYASYSPGSKAKGFSYSNGAL